MITATLSIPPPGDRTLERLNRKVRLLAVRYLMTLPPRSLPERPSALVAVQRVLTRELKRDGAAVLAAIGSPDVLPNLLAAYHGQIEVDEALRRSVPSLLATIGRATEAILWDVSVAAMSDGRRVWRFEPPALGLTLDPTGLTIRLADGTLAQARDLASEQPFHELAAGVHLATWDDFAMSMYEAHPDKEGNALSLGDRPVEDWVSALREALELVRETLPTWHAELPATLTRLVPVGWEPEKHLSASYREAPNTAWMTLHPDVMTLAEAIVHETQHGKLNAALNLDPLLHNGLTFWTESPVRPDLRPLLGVLLAVHAFVPVALMHRKMADMDRFADHGRYHERRAQVLASNQRGLDILRESAEPTELGARIIADLDRLHAMLVEDAGSVRDAKLEEMVG